MKKPSPVSPVRLEEKVAGKGSIMKADEMSNELDVLAEILLRCFLFSLALLIVWFMSYVVGGDWIYSIHAKWFNVSKHEFVLMNYYGMALVKLCAVVFFLLPYGAIKLRLRKKKYSM
ncbi:MAG: hypothetical protein P8X67_07525 [Syntrophobacterales bacterium]